jgi:hypothetical protein
MLNQPSTELLSQLISPRSLADFLSRWCQRTQWENHHRTHDLSCEFWATGLWIRQVGLVSYQSWANFLIYHTNTKASVLQVRQLSKTLYLVQGSQKSWYAVHRLPSRQLKCECILYRNRANRLSRELPTLFQRLQGQIFCHHTAAIESVHFVR